MHFVVLAMEIVVHEVLLEFPPVPVRKLLPATGNLKEDVNVAVRALLAASDAADDEHAARVLFQLDERVLAQDAQNFILGWELLFGCMLRLGLLEKLRV